MIKTKHGRTKITGSVHEVYADLACIAKTIFESFKKDMPEDVSKAKIRDAVELALMSKDEFEERFLRAIKEKLKDVSELLGDTDEDSGEGDANGD